MNNNLGTVVCRDADRMFCLKKYAYHSVRRGNHPSLGGDDSNSLSENFLTEGGIIYLFQGNCLSLHRR